MGYAFADLLGGDSENYADQAAQQEARRQAAIKKGTTDIDNAFAGFTPDFYKKREQAYQDFAMPELGKQYDQTKSQIGFNLANRGLTTSGAANRQWGELAKTMTSAKQNVVDSGISQAQMLQQQVEASKNQQLANLYQSADPSNAGSQAVASAASFARPSTFPALASQFNGLLNQYYTSQLINSFKPMSYVASPNDKGSSVSWPTTISTTGV